MLLGLDAREGKEIWRHAYPAVAVSGPAASYPGPRSSPAAGGGRVVMLGVGGVVTCLDIATGRLMWRNQEFTNALPRFFTASSPLLVDGLCLVHVGGKDQGTLLALRLADGSAHWSWRGEGPAYASPVVMTAGGVKQIVLQTESHLRGLSLTEGKPLWEIPTPPRSGYWNSVTPVIDGATVIYSGQGRGTHAVRILGGEGGFSAEAVWSNDKVGAVYSTAVLRGGLLYGLSDRGLFFCLRAGTGETAWTATHRVSYFGAVIDAGPVLLALPEKSGLIAFKPGDQGYEELARIPVSESPIYAHPVAAGRRIFIRDAETVALWLLE